MNIQIVFPSDISSSPQKLNVGLLFIAVCINFIEMVSKSPLGLNLCVGLRRPILEIFPIFLRLAVSVRLDLEPD